MAEESDEAVAADGETELPEELVITLRKPIAYAKVDYAELRLREPTVSEMEKASAQRGITSSIVCISLVSGVPEGAIRMMGARDFGLAEDYITGFINGGRSTAT